MTSNPTPTVTIQCAIFKSAELLNKELTVQGTVVLVDPALNRMDIAENGAKLIVRLLVVPSSEQSEKEEDPTSSVVVGSTVTVTGILRKEQRRTFLQATSVVQLISLHLEQHD